MNPYKKAKRDLKRNVAKATGVPTTKSGRKRKQTALLNNGWLWLIVIVAAVMFFGSQ